MVKLFIGLISAKEKFFEIILHSLEKKFGPSDLISPLIDFTYTKYYEREFGPDLKRQFLSFKKPISERNLSSIKLYTNTLERKHSKENKRLINIDPGVLYLGKIILFSTKDYNHRIYLGSGIYAEVTLKFEKNSYAPWPWTYPDYGTKDYIRFFNNVRALYSKQLK